MTYTCEGSDQFFNGAIMAWFVQDRWGNEITLTQERWQHIAEGHWEIKNRRADVLKTIRRGTRKQYPDDPTRYRYALKFPDLPYNYTHIFVIVRLANNKFIITAYPKYVR